jgi:ATP-dependent DNA ligase
MQLSVSPPILPMLANRVGELPQGAGWIFEPKWDGFRTLIFRDGDELLIQSRDEKPLERYFPELIEPLKAQLPERCVLDGEIVIALGDALDFETLQLRLHPAASRIKLLARETPASVVFFDILCWRRRRHRSTSRRRREIAPSPRTGSGGSRARASTA